MSLAFRSDIPKSLSSASRVCAAHVDAACRVWRFLRVSSATIRAGAWAWCSSCNRDADARNNRGRKLQFYIWVRRCRGGQSGVTRIFSTPRPDPLPVRGGEGIFFVNFAFFCGQPVSCRLCVSWLSVSGRAGGSGSPAGAAGTGRLFPASCVCREFDSCSKNGELLLIDPGSRGQFSAMEIRVHLCPSVVETSRGGLICLGSK